MKTRTEPRKRKTYRITDEQLDACMAALEYHRDITLSGLDGNMRTNPTEADIDDYCERFENIALNHRTLKELRTIKGGRSEP